MDRLLVDTKIVIDLLSKREEFYKEAQELFTLADQKKVKLYISSLTIANTHYLLARQHKLDEARKILLKFKVLVGVLAMDDKILELALVADFKDFEDAIQYHTALENELDLIVTRNKKDFKNAKLPVLTAREYLKKSMRKSTEIILSTTINAPIQLVFDSSRSIDIHLLSTTKTNEKAIAGRTSGLCELGDEVTWRAKHFGIYQNLSSKITKLKAPFYFQDCMIKGAFSFIEHDHFFEEDNAITTMKDVFTYGVPYGWFGRIFDKIILKNYMIKLLTTRNNVIKEIAEANFKSEIKNMI